MLRRWTDRLLNSPLKRKIYLLFMLAFFGAAFAFKPAMTHGSGNEGGGQPFSFFSPFQEGYGFNTLERTALIVVLAIAVAGLLYALMLVKQVMAADQGTKKMQEIADAVREGANAYLKAQFTKIGPLIVIITVLMAVTYTGHENAFRYGRAAAFLMGSIFSWLVGFVGMRLATQGNLRVAAAAKRSYGEAMQLGYRTGTITGMLTDGLGLLGMAGLAALLGGREPFSRMPVSRPS